MDRDELSYEFSVEEQEIYLKNMIDNFLRTQEELNLEELQLEQQCMANRSEYENN
jgi:hypothetical protein